MWSDFIIIKQHGLYKIQPLDTMNSPTDSYPCYAQQYFRTRKEAEEVRNVLYEEHVHASLKRYHQKKFAIIGMIMSVCKTKGYHVFPYMLRENRFAVTLDGRLGINFTCSDHQDVFCILYTDSTLDVMLVDDNVRRTVTLCENQAQNKDVLAGR